MEIFLKQKMKKNEMVPSLQVWIAKHLIVPTKEIHSNKKNQKNKTNIEVHRSQHFSSRASLLPHILSFSWNPIQYSSHQYEAICLQTPSLADQVVHKHFYIHLNIMVGLYQCHRQPLSCPHLLIPSICLHQQLQGLMTMALMEALEWAIRTMVPTKSLQI